MELKKLNFEAQKATFSISKREKIALGIQITYFVTHQKFYSDDPEYFKKYEKLSICKQILNKIKKVLDDDKSLILTIPEVCFLAIEDNLVLNPALESFEVFDNVTLMEIQKELLKHSKV